MNRKTAEYYNKLLARMKSPIEINPTARGYKDFFSGGDAEEVQSLYDFAETLASRVVDEAIRQEIIRAAKTCRRAHVTLAEPILTWGQCNGGSEGAAGLIKEMIMPEVKTEIERLNKLAESNFIEYATCCAQGVARPPED